MAVDLEKLNTNGTDTFNQLISKFNDNMDSLNDDCSNKDTMISNIQEYLGNELKSQILNWIYPIGSIYISTNSANPSSFRGVKHDNFI